MRDPARISQICALLEEAWVHDPDQRLGQFISNLLGAGPHDVFYVEDDQWEELLVAFLRRTDKATVDALGDDEE